MGSMAAAPCHLVAVPFPGRGHVNSMLNLCRLLAARDGVSATVVVTEEWLGLLGGSPALEPGIRLEAIPNVIPSEHGRAADWVGFVEAVYTKMEAPFEQLLDRLGAAPAAIVADTYVPWAVSVGNRRGIPQMGGAALVAEAELLLRRTAEAGSTPASTGSTGRINQSAVFSAHAPHFLFTGVRLVCLTGFIHRASLNR
jgi:hypothetical protein